MDNSTFCAVLIPAIPIFMRFRFQRFQLEILWGSMQFYGYMRFYCLNRPCLIDKFLPQKMFMKFAPCPDIVDRIKNWKENKNFKFTHTVVLRFPESGYEGILKIRTYLAGCLYSEIRIVCPDFDSSGYQSIRIVEWCFLMLRYQISGHRGTTVHSTIFWQILARSAKSSWSQCYKKLYSRNLLKARGRIHKRSYPNSIKIS